MTQDRFARLKDLLLKASDLPETKRQAFLDDACKDDPDLRKEVERILEYDAAASGVLKTGAGMVTPRSLIEDVTTTQEHQIKSPERIAGYRIIRKLGEGGMGVVYEAEQESPRRPVALKVVRGGACVDEHRVKLFRREVQTLGRLKHPSIAAIYEAGRTEHGQHFFAMELVAGVPLDEYLEARPLKGANLKAEIRARLSLFLQICGAISYAHQRGVIHRDLKPTNILVATVAGGSDSRSGSAAATTQVKVLDFGLARITDTDVTMTTMATEVGKIQGTLPYMSPEQARGNPEAIDLRSDVYSLGVILYEMVTGERPYDIQRTMVHEAVRVICEEEPARPSTIERTVRGDLETIALKALEKEPGRRYQSVSALAGDIDRYLTDQPILARPPNATYRARKFVRRHRSAVGIGVVAVLAVTALAVAIGLGVRLRDERPAPFRIGRSVQVTSDAAWEGEPAISPDGKRVAFVADRMGNRDVYVVDARGDRPTRLTDHPSSDRYPAWFPDGRTIAFVSDRSGSASIWTVGLDGGDPILVVPDAQYPSLSPDGNSIAFSRADSTGNLRIARAPLNDPAASEVLTGPEDGQWDHLDPSWSPDGRSIAYATQSNIWVLSLDSGTTRPATTHGFFHRYPAWSADCRYLYFASEWEGTRAIWWAHVADGVPHRITLGTGSESHPSVSTDGRRLAYATHSEDSDIVLLDVETGVERVLSGPLDERMPSFSPDGNSVVFVSERRDAQGDLWLQQWTGDRISEARRITDRPGMAAHPAISPDGQWIAYYEIIEGTWRDIWLVPITGGSPVRFTMDPAPDVQPAWSPDGSALAFISERDGARRVWVAAIRDGERVGEPHPVTPSYMEALAPAWSPDGLSIAYVGWTGEGTEIWITSAEGTGVPRQVTRDAGALSVRWGPSGRTLVAIVGWEGETDSLELQAIDPETGRTIPSRYAVGMGRAINNPGFDISADGRRIAFARQETRGDIWILESEYDGS